MIFLHYFANLIKGQQEWHGYEVQKEPENKHMFRYTSEIGQILLKSHLKFESIQSSSNVVQTNNQKIGEVQI